MLMITKLNPVKVILQLRVSYKVEAMLGTTHTIFGLRHWSALSPFWVKVSTYAIDMGKHLMTTFV